MNYELVPCGNAHGINYVNFQYNNTVYNMFIQGNLFTIFSYAGLEYRIPYDEVQSDDEFNFSLNSVPCSLSTLIKICKDVEGSDYFYDMKIINT